MTYAVLSMFIHKRIYWALPVVIVVCFFIQHPFKRQNTYIYAVHTHTQTNSYGCVMLATIIVLGRLTKHRVLYTMMKGLFFVQNIPLMLVHTTNKLAHGISFIITAFAHHHASDEKTSFCWRYIILISLFTVLSFGIYFCVCDEQKRRQQRRPN